MATRIKSSDSSSAIARIFAGELVPIKDLKKAIASISSVDKQISWWFEQWALHADGRPTFQLRRHENRIEHISRPATGELSW